MKRSEINTSIQLALDVFEAHRFPLPKWAAWAPLNWEHCGIEAAQIKTCMLGWQVTDFNRGDFREQGLVFFVLRNGIVNELRPAALRAGVADKEYGEQIGIIQKRQVTPMLLHERVDKDLINRGGGDLVVQLYQATEDGELDEKRRIPTFINGIAYNIKAGGITRLAPGDAITIRAGSFHKFWAEKAGCMFGEVFSVSHQAEDCVFLEDGRWFADIEEDEEALFLLRNEYPELE
jgi:D-lyxose ketol-isomerase